MSCAVLSPRRSLPHIPVSTRQGIYEGEYHKLWMVAKLKTCSHPPFCNRLGAYFPQEPTPFSAMNFNCLPRMWRLDSMNTHWGIDTMLWRLMAHSQVSDTEQLILMLIKDTRDSR
uniref:Uncharacterized protein n=1 Tax=Mus spicilegus TaxID=10103 RepID=A0A8C6G789_MUSSI